MNRTHRIVLHDRLLPAQVFFNSIPDRRFTEILEAFSRGVGSGFDLAACTFPGDLPEGETPIQGIEFSLTNGETVTLTYRDFFDILKRTCAIYLTDNVADTQNVMRRLVQIEKLLENPNNPVLQPGRNLR